MNDDQLRTERNRFIALNAVRISGALMIVFGMAVISRRFVDLPIEAGYAIFAVGIIDFIVAPLLLARAWSTPKDL